jgi:hypothetical protein
MAHIELGAPNLGFRNRADVAGDLRILKTTTFFLGRRVA